MAFTILSCHLRHFCQKLKFARKVESYETAGSIMKGNSLYDNDLLAPFKIQN